MKNLKKLVIASFMLVIAFVAVVSSTYAWFTRGSDAKVNNIEIGVVNAEKSLLIGKEDGKWTKNVTVTPFGKITPVTLISKTNGTQVDKFQQLIWGGDLTPEFIDAKPLNEEYVKASGSYDPTKTYYTLNYNTGAYTQVTNNDEDDFANYYEKSQNINEYVKASGEFNDNTDYYTLSGNEYVLVDNANAEDINSYYVKNNNYVAEGYIKFNLFFQITVDDASDWERTSIQMSLDGLHAFDYDEYGDVTDDENQRAVSSFRLAVAEGAPQTQTIARIIEGVGGYATEGRYGVGTQFALSNGWLELVHNAMPTYLDKDEDTDHAYELHTPDVASNAYSGNDPLVVLDAAGTNSVPAYEYTMNCGTDTTASQAQISVSDDKLTKTFQITIYVWMEGWDGDNINAAAGCQYIFGLSFRAN